MTTYTATLIVERIRCDACQKLDIGLMPLMTLYRDDGTPMHACDGNNDACVKVVRELVKKPLSKPGDFYEALAREAAAAAHRAQIRCATEPRMVELTKEDFYTLSDVSARNQAFRDKYLSGAKLISIVNRSEGTAVVVNKEQAAQHIKVFLEKDTGATAERAYGGSVFSAGYPASEVSAAFTAVPLGEISASHPFSDKVARVSADIDLAKAVIGKLKGLVAEHAQDTVDSQAALAPTREVARAALLDLRRRHSVHASLEIMQRYADNWRVPLLDSVPTARYADLIADCKSWTPA